MNAGGSGAPGATNDGARSASHGNTSRPYKLRKSPKKVHEAARSTKPSRLARPPESTNAGRIAGSPTSTSNAPRSPSTLSGIQKAAVATVTGSAPDVATERRITCVTKAIEPASRARPPARRSPARVILCSAITRSLAPELGAAKRQNAPLGAQDRSNAESGDRAVDVLNIPAASQRVRRGVTYPDSS
jgi:hypothetical protein